MQCRSREAFESQAARRATAWSEGEGEVGGQEMRDEGWHHRTASKAQKVQFPLLIYITKDNKNKRWNKNYINVETESIDKE